MILIPKLYPFAKECLKTRPDTIIQEDKAPAHASRYNLELLHSWGLTALEWPGNSPDINAIEPTWNWMKRQTTAKGGFTSKKAIEEAWYKC